MAIKDPIINISGVPFPVKFGYLSYSIFNGQGYTLDQCANAEILLRLYHSAILAGCQRNNVPELPWAEFKSKLDDDDNTEVFHELTKLYQTTNEAKK